MHLVEELRCVGKGQAVIWCTINQVRVFCRNANLIGEVLGFYERRRSECLTMNELIGALHPILEMHGSRR